jgi:hypothetical protein
MTVDSGPDLAHRPATRQNIAGETPMQPVKTEFLFRIALQVNAPFADLGETPFGKRMIARVNGGTVEGPKINGTVRDGGGDWLLLRRDGALQLDVRLIIETDDGALIYMTYRGVRHGPAEVMARLGRGETVDPSEYYFRSTPYFETSSDKYAWMNKIVCVAMGSRIAAGPIYEVHQVL